VSRTVITNRTERPAHEPLYAIEPQTGATIEVFYADAVLARSFGAPTGWFWWSCVPGCLPDIPPHGPFGSSYQAFCDATRMRSKPTHFGRRMTTCSIKL
jgi:hypothetical protein